MATPGWAGTLAAQTAYLSYLPSVDPPEGREDEPATAVCDWWEPPHPMALPEDTCERIIQAALPHENTRSMTGTYHFEVPLEEADRAAVLDRAVEANQLWWRLLITHWEIRVKRYSVGEEHGEHTDWHPGGGGGSAKFSISVQLSTPDSYTGGALRVRHWDHDLEVPRTQGTLAAYPGWIYHRAEPVSAGQRWCLVVHGWGPPLR